MVTRNWFLAGSLHGLATYLFINHVMFMLVGLRSSFTALPPWPSL